ncbi:hypothetical protein HOC35_02690, partial [Candidatus Woesearchaeota archaeon]|nr:hypothetical protein [Candidatus Woesearchaeota archaeon]
MVKEIQFSKSMHFVIYILVILILIGLAIFLYSVQDNSQDNNFAGKATGDLAGKATGGFDCLSNGDCDDGVKCIGGFCGDSGTTYDDFSDQENNEDDLDDLSCMTDDDCFPDETCIDGLCEFFGEECSPECNSNEECMDGM